MLMLATTQHKDRLGSYPLCSLRCVLVSGHQELQIYEYFHVKQAQHNTMHAPLRPTVNRP